MQSWSNCIWIFFKLDISTNKKHRSSSTSELDIFVLPRLDLLLTRSSRPPHLLPHLPRPLLALDRSMNSLLGRVHLYRVIGMKSPLENCIYWWLNFFISCRRWKKEESRLSSLFSLFEGRDISRWVWWIGEGPSSVDWLTLIFSEEGADILNCLLFLIPVLVLGGGNSVGYLIILIILRNSCLLTSIILNGYPLKIDNYFFSFFLHDPPVCINLFL